MLVVGLLAVNAARRSAGLRARALERAGTPLARPRSRPGARARTLGDWLDRDPVALPLALAATIRVATALALRPLFSTALGAAGAAPRFAVAYLASVLLLAPLAQAARTLALAALAWTGATLARRRAPLHTLSSAFALADVVLALATAAAMAALALRGPATIRTPADLRPRIGIDALVRHAPSAIQMLARGASLTHLAWWLALVVLIPRHSGLSRRAAIALATGAWLTVAIAPLARTALAP